MSDEDFDERSPDDFAGFCPACSGSGIAPDNGTNMGECDECNGTGYIG